MKKVIRAYVFDAQLVGFHGVSRRIEIRGDQTLIDLHEALFGAFGWWEEHLFAFWLSGEFWGDRASEYGHPLTTENDVMAPYSDGPRAKSADVRIDRLKLERDQPLAYIFDFGDEWRVELKLADVRVIDADPYPRVIESRGEAPPQYPEFDDEAA